MSAYKEKIRQPLSNIRRWIADFGSSAIIPPLLLEEGSTTRTTADSISTGISTPGMESTTTTTLVGSDIIDAENKGSSEMELENIKQSFDNMKVCSNISKTQMKEFREAFGFFDKDGDGFITSEELGIVMRSLGQFASEEELKEMLKEVDINGDGLFSIDEFVEIVSNYSGNTSGNTDEEQELRDAFRIFDKHSRGFISASDLRAVLHCLGEDLSEDEIEDMIKEVDVDGDGRIDFNEFVRALGEPDEIEEDFVEATLS